MPGLSPRRSPSAVGTADAAIQFAVSDLPLGGTTFFAVGTTDFLSTLLSRNKPDIAADQRAVSAVGAAESSPALQGVSIIPTGHWSGNTIY